MPSNFKLDTSINALLYILQQLNGICDEHKICKIFYYADQLHWSQYGRSITNDSYIAMKYGPVPSSILDIINDIRVAGRFPEDTENQQYLSDLSAKFKFEGSYDIKALKQPDMDSLSESDVECLNNAIDFCKDKTFKQLTNISHGLAWNNTQLNKKMSLEDILKEAGNEPEYISYLLESIHK